MNEQEARAVLLVKAIETAPEAASWLTEAQREAATAAALSAAPRPAADGQRLAWTEGFLARRALGLEHLLSDRQPRLHALLGATHWLALWRWAVPLAGLLAGLLAEFWVSPREIDLLSPALTTFVLWNLLVYLGLVVAGARSLASSARPSRAAAWLSRLAWPRRWTRGLWGVSRQFQRDWMRLAGAATGARLLASLHLAAALGALGMVAALLFKGFFTEFHVGWQSQWLDARQMHALFDTVGQWLGAAPTTLADMARLERGTGATKADGSHWALWWTRLLLLGVAVPRLLLAGWSAWRARRRLRELHPDLSDAYFVRLLAEHGGPPATAVVLPYSLTASPAQVEGLRDTVRRSLGLSAKLRLLPATAYGDDAPALPATERGRQRQVIVLFGLGATPERETHGRFLQQVQAHAGAPVSVWLDASALAARLTPGARGARLAERESLWRDFLGPSNPVQVWTLEAPSHD